MSTDTPRTDAAVTLSFAAGHNTVCPNFARTLERELAIERARLAGVIEIKRFVEAELAEMKRRLSSEKLMYKLANDSAIKHELAAGELRNELAAERARLDWLSTRGFEHRHHETGDHLGHEWTISSYGESEDVTLRDVIDAEMREDAK